MEPGLIGILGIAALLILLASGMKVAYVMGLVGFLGFLFLAGSKVAFGVLYNFPYQEFASWQFSVIPLFILMGNFAFSSGITADLFKSARKCLGHIPGGIGVATVAAAAGFAAATGASMASAAAMSKIAVPEMEKHGYQRKLALGTVASGGTLAGVIPPSIGLIIYGMITEVSIARLLIAGILPGIMIACLLSIFIVLRVIRNPQLAPVVPEVPFREKLTSLRSVWGIVVVIFCVLGSLYFGVTTPTEAAAFGAMGAFIIALILRRLNRKNAKQSLFDTGRTTAMIMLILVCGTIFSRFLTMSGLPDDFTGFIKNINLSPMAIITAIGITYLVLGMFLDQLSITVITLPVFFPLVVSLGFDPIWFGIFFDVLTNLGQITPPIGLVCFVIKGSVPNCTLEEVFAGVAPFFIVEILALVILTIFPKIATFLPSLMMQ